MQRCSIHLLATKAGTGLAVQINSMKSNVTKDLLSFGNYLFNKYSVKVYSDDGNNTPINLRQVSDSDIQDWETNKSIEGRAYNNYDNVNVCFPLGVYENCKVISVRTSPTKVFYDLEYRYDVEIDNHEAQPGPDNEGYFQSSTIGTVTQKVVRFYNVDGLYIKRVGEV